MHTCNYFKTNRSQTFLQIKSDSILRLAGFDGPLDSIQDFGAASCDGKLSMVAPTVLAVQVEFF